MTTFVLLSRRRSEFDVFAAFTIYVCASVVRCNGASSFCAWNLSEERGASWGTGRRRYDVVDNVGGKERGRIVIVVLYG